MPDNETEIKEIQIKSVEKLSMSETDVLFVTVKGNEIDQRTFQFLHDELKELFGHERFMIISDGITLKVVSGLKKKVEEIVCDNCEQEPCVCDRPRAV